MSRTGSPGLDELQSALDEGDTDRLRRSLLALSSEDQDLLAQELGADTFAHTMRIASAGGRRSPRGRVIVLPGIMGTDLDVIHASGDSDRVWINYARLILGRIADLKFEENGASPEPRRRVRPAGINRKTYLPLVVALDTQWEVRPFPFDWRDDMDDSAAALDELVKSFGEGGPVHLVAHSMGGLVARRFIQRSPQTWASMADADGNGRGGRLVMMGTPNRGSFAIPLTLTGAEKLVRALERADVRHDLRELLAIIATFPGLYQMLPSALVDLGDDHLKLFDEKTWKSEAVRKPLLEGGREFIAGLHEVEHAERLLYIAGFDRPTPHRIKVDEPGRFSYTLTPDGDGRVAHELGLLPGVTTYWVDEVHGDLPKNRRVLDGIHDLLRRGETTVMPTQKPPSGRPRAVPEGWVRGDEIAPVPPAIDTILAGTEVSRAGGEPRLTPEDAVRLENLTFAEYLGSGGDPTRGTARDGPAGDSPSAGTAPGRRLRFAIQVVWGDITEVTSDVYAVGHYRGVLPQNAELALDRLVSGIPAEETDYESYRRRLVITQHTRRGTLRGALGDVDFFPVGSRGGRGRFVAVAGMGDPGTFDQPALSRLVSGMIVALGALPTARTISSVLIGSGEGTLTIRQALEGLLDGITAASQEIAAADELVFSAPVTKLLLVERDRQRAYRIHEVLSGLLSGRTSPHFDLTVARTVIEGAGRAVSPEDGLALLADSAVVAAGRPVRSPAGRALRTLVGSWPQEGEIRDLALEALQAEAGRDGPASPVATRFRVERRRDEDASWLFPSRVSFRDDGEQVRVAAIHPAATVPERAVPVGRDVVDDLVAGLVNPPVERIYDLCRLLHRLLVPDEFKDALRRGPLVLEVDRTTARVQWEMLAGDSPGGEPAPPIAVERPFARQLRTAYSPPPLPPRSGRMRRFRALVIGDPGDPEKGHDLPGARTEALLVKRLLEERDVEVEARIGAPSVARDGPLYGVAPADRLDVLGLLVRGEFDLVHYAGHGDFDPLRPDSAGWLFARGLLRAGEIGRAEHVPSVVVANACLSGLTSQTLESGRTTGEGNETGLLPTLADEFFRLGVRNYVGTAWEVSDVGAELFAETFYAALFDGALFGEAVRLGREALWSREATFGALWAAYQHYGDPTADLELALR